MSRLTRRRFLSSAAVLPLAVPQFARATSANDRIAIGFIGVGVQGVSHLGSFLKRKECEVVAVCDVVKERVENAVSLVEKQYAERKKNGTFAGVGSYTDYRKLLEHKGLDAVVIATPDHWHANTAIHAARAGKHIYCEKPLTNYLADGRAIVDEVAKAKVIFQTGSQQRSEFSNNFRNAVEAIWNGRIGKLKVIRIGVGSPAIACDLPTQETPAGTDWDFWLGPAPNRGYNEVLCPKGVHKHYPHWRKYREYGGGALADMGAHHFDIAQWAMGMDTSGPREIVPPADPKKTAGLKFIYANGVTVIHDEFEDGKRVDCLFEGTDGKIFAGRDGIRASRDSILKDPLPKDAKRIYTSSSQKGNWLDCIRSGKECICPAETGHRTASICHLANIGYRCNRKLTWDTVKEKFVNDNEANKWLSRQPREKWQL